MDTFINEIITENDELKQRNSGLSALLNRYRSDNARLRLALRTYSETGGALGDAARKALRITIEEEYRHG